MLAAFGLSIQQLSDRRFLAVLGKSVAITLALCLVLGATAFAGLNRLIGWGGLNGDLVAGGDTLRAVLAAIAALVGAWLLFRLIAIAVVQFFGDEIVAAVEHRHYPVRAATARPLGLRAELRQAVRGMARAVSWNVAALPVAAILLTTGLGPALMFFFVNAVLIGRELADMVRLRHGDAAGQPLPLPPLHQRLALGMVVAGLLAVPLVNFIAPVIGAAAATHLVLRRHSGATHAPA